MVKVAVWILIVAIWVVYWSWVAGLMEVPIWTVGGILSLLGAIGAFVGLVILSVIIFMMSFD